MTYSKENKGYKDRTGNLKNSISFAIFKDGKLITSAINTKEYKAKYTDESGKIIKNPLSKTEVEEAAKSNLESFAQQNGVVSQQGFTIIVVAGMNYGKYVEDKGYNVLQLTKYFLEDSIKKALEDMFRNMRNEN